TEDDPEVAKEQRIGCGRCGNYLWRKPGRCAGNAASPAGHIRFMSERNPTQTVVVVGGGFSGSVFALKYARANPDAHVIVVERSRRVGRGLAYGACAPDHLLNVPVSRMELGLAPPFGDWLQGHRRELDEALTESGGDLHGAFVPRALFGAYLEERIA